MWNFGILMPWLQDILLKRQAGKTMWEYVLIHAHTGYHVVDLVEITQHPVMINGDPSKGQVY